LDLSSETATIGLAIIFEYANKAIDAPKRAINSALNKYLPFIAFKILIKLSFRRRSKFVSLPSQKFNIFITELIHFCFTKIMHFSNDFQ